MKLGFYYAFDKKKLDKYFDDSEEFRISHPDYKKWEGDYAIFEE